MSKPAFRNGEAVKFVGSERLGELLVELTTKSPLSIHQLLSPKFTEMGQQLAIIERVGQFHLDIPLYQINGSNFRWPESAFVDPQLEPSKPAGHPYSRASLSYKALVVDGSFEIQDSMGFCYCRRYLRSPQVEVIAANEIAELRCRIAFEALYGFEAKKNNET